MAETIGRAEVIIVADGSEFAISVQRVVREEAPELERAGGSAGKSFSTGFDKESAKRLDESLSRMRSKLDQQGRAWKKAGEGLGRAFGRGSRNDLLNIIGGIVSIAPRLIGALARMGAAITEFARKRLARATKDAESFKDVLMNLAGQGLQGLIAAAAIAAAAIQVSVAAMGPLASAVVLVTGLVLSLAGSLGFALVGGLVAVAGALVPFAAAIGVAALAISGLSKKTEAFKDLKEEWKDLKKETATKLFGKDGGGLVAVTALMKSLRPVILGVAGALGDMLENLGKFAKTKGFQDAMKGIADVLPGMVTQLGKIGGNLLLGLGRAFVAAEPMITEFLGWLEGLTKKFADAGLTPGAKPGGKGGGDSPLKIWLDDAWTSAKKVGGLIQEVALAIGDLFGAGKGTGDNIFVLLTDKVKEFRDWLKRAEEDGSLQKFFDDAQRLAIKIGEVIGKVIELIDKLDTPANRTILFKLLEITANLLTGIGLVIDKTNELNEAQQKAANEGMASFKQRTDEATDGTAWDRLKTRINEAFNGVAWASLTTRASEAWAGIKGVFSNVGSFFSGVGASISSTVSEGWGRLKVRAAEAKNGIVNAFSGLAGKVRKAAGNVVGTVSEGWGRLKTRAAEARTGVVNAFTNLSGKIIAKAGSLSSRFSTWVASLPGKARTLASSIANAFSGLAGRMIAKAGSAASRFASWVSSLPGKARAIATSIANAFSGLASKAMAKAGSITGAIGSWASGVYSRARGVANDIVSAFSGLASRIVAAIGTIVPNIRMPSIPRPTVTAIVKGVTASGGVFDGAQLRVIGEAGPEAVVPLNRALNRVDPAVRALSAFAQGMTPPSGTAPASTGRHIEVGGITINTPTQDARAVASEVIARMTFAAYI